MEYLKTHGRHLSVLAVLCVAAMSLGGCLMVPRAIPALPGLRPRGPQGPPGVAGKDGRDGIQGPPGPGSAVYANRSDSNACGWSAAPRNAGPARSSLPRPACPAKAISCRPASIVAAALGRCRARRRPTAWYCSAPKSEGRHFISVIARRMHGPTGGIIGRSHRRRRARSRPSAISAGGSNAAGGSVRLTPLATRLPISISPSV